MRILLLLLISLNCFALERDVLVRDPKGKLIVQKANLKNLLSKTHFEGKYFKIVHGDSEDVVSIENSLKSDKAANIYYHLTKAREYFITLGKVQTDQLVIRLDIENGFHKKYHFKNSKVDPEYNNACTVAAGEGVPEYGVNPWGTELWFRPVKKIKLTKEFKKEFKAAIRKTIPKRTKISADFLIFTGVNAAVSGDFKGSLESSGRALLTNFITDTVTRMLMPELMALFLGNYFYFDTAFIPEVIYHEYTHYAMSDHVSPSVNNTLLEGFADFFATKINNDTKLAHKLGDFGALVDSRDALSKQFFTLDIDSEGGLGSDFVLSLFHELDIYLSNYEDSLWSQKKIFDLRKRIDLNSNIKDDLPNILWQEFPKYQVGLTILLHKRGI